MCMFFSCLFGGLHMTPHVRDSSAFLSINLGVFSSSIYLFSPQIASMMELSLSGARSFSWVSCERAGHPKTWAILHRFPSHSRGAAWEVEQQGQKSAPIQKADATGRGLAYYTTGPNPCTPFSSSFRYTAGQMIPASFNRIEEKQPYFCRQFR